MITLHAIEAGPVATMGYMLVDSNAASAIVIDVPHSSAQWFVESAANANCHITDIILTHSHWDHTADCALLQRMTGATVYVHAKDEYRLRSPNEHTVWPLPFNIEPVCDARLITTTHIETLDTSVGVLTLLFTPGHTEGGIVILDQTRTTAFVGDTLFAGSVGRTDLPGGDMEELLRSIHTQLLVLADDIVILPGHGPSSTIGNERQSNPFLRESF